jgi:hypothetical protein
LSANSDAGTAWSAVQSQLVGQIETMESAARGVATGPHEFAELVAEFEYIEARRSSAGDFLSDTDALRFDEIQQRLQLLLSSRVKPFERRRNLRVPSDLWVRVHHGDDSKPGVIDDIGVGGVFVATLLSPAIGETVEIQIEPRPEVLDHTIMVRGRVAWSGEFDRGGFGVVLDASQDEAVRRLRQLVMVLLRRLIREPW